MPCETIECPWCQTTQMNLHQTSTRFANDVYWECPKCRRISDMISRDEDAIAVGRKWAKETRYAICQK